MSARLDRKALFLRRVKQGDGCWEWTGGIDKQGYGRCLKHERAHRFSWEMWFGEIPAGLNVLHRCDNRRCVRPDHLFLGTHRDNVDDKVRKGRQTRGENNALARLTAVQVREILARYVPRKVTLRMLAVEYGVSESQIHLIVSRKSWKHVELEIEEVDHA